MRPVLLSLAVILVCVWSGSEARGLAPRRNHEDRQEPRQNLHQPRETDQKCVGRCAAARSMESSFYNSGLYYSGDSSLGSFSYGSGSYDYSSMVSPYYSTAYDYDSSFGSYWYSYGDSMMPPYYSSGSYWYSYSGSMMPSYWYSYSGSMMPSYSGSMGSSYSMPSYWYSYSGSMMPSYSGSMGSSYSSSGSYWPNYSSSMGSSYGSGVTEPSEQPATTIPSAETCTCGVRNVPTRIVGGEEASENEFPWQVGLVPKGGKKPFCGGSIIANKWILTAAHCVDESTASTTEVVVGDHDRSTTDETQKTMAINKVIVHAGYDSSTVDNDIALLELKDAIVFSSDNKIAPVCLPSPENDFAKESAIVSGWGTLSSGGRQPNILNYVGVETMTNEECKNTNYADDDITDNMICAGVLPDGGKDSCQGDSGGPLVTDKANFSELIGVVSWGSGCADKGYPGVYTRVSNYREWITKNTGDSFVTCKPKALV